MSRAAVANPGAPRPKPGRRTFAAAKRVLETTQNQYAGTGQDRQQEDQAESAGGGNGFHLRGGSRGEAGVGDEQRPVAGSREPLDTKTVAVDHLEIGTIGMGDLTVEVTAVLQAAALEGEDVTEIGIVGGDPGVDGGGAVTGVLRGREMIGSAGDRAVPGPP